MKEDNKKTEQIKIDDAFLIGVEGVTESDDGKLDIKKSQILYSTVDDYRFEKESQNESGLCKAKKLLDNLRKSMKKDGLI